MDKRVVYSLNIFDDIRNVMEKYNIEKIELGSISMDSAENVVFYFNDKPNEEKNG